MYAVCIIYHFWVIFRHHMINHMYLVLLSEVLFLAFTFGGLGSDLLVILLEGGEILTGLGELSFFHTLSTYQWTKARLAYMRSNLWSIRERASAMAVVLETMHTALWTRARSPPGTTVGGW